MPEPTQHPAREAGLSEELCRERLLDMEERMAPYRRRAFVVLAFTLLLAGPWEGWWWILPLGAALAAFAVVDTKISGSLHPGRWMAGGWAVSPLMIAVSVALTGANGSPAMAWFALPAVTLGMRFERRGVIYGGCYIGALLIASTFAIHPGRMIDDPTPLIFTAGLILAAIFLSAAIVQSDREHRRSSVVDPLTGLLNRAALAQKVDELGPTGEVPRPLGILIGDLDHFKRVNDEHGHAMGDAVLRDVAYAIARALRSFDVAYRIGGEEFLVLLPDADTRGVELVGERLREAVRECSQPDLPISMSFGGAAGECDGAEFPALSAAADRALYEAKNRGRDCLVMADGMFEPVSDRRPMVLTHSLRPV